jgi:hypothetical protein
MTLQLKEPFLISSRLLPAIKVGDCTISLDFDGYTCTVYFDFDNGESYEDDNLHPPRCGSPSTQDMFRSLFSFMSACGESVNYSRSRDCEGENADLFCTEVAEFCAEHGDELSMLACELEETPDLISEVA